MRDHASTVHEANNLRLASRYSQAIDLLAEYTQVIDADADAWTVLGLCYMNTGRLVIAIGYFNKALTILPQSSVISYFIAFCILKYTCYTDSLPFFKNAIYNGADHPDLWLWYGEALLRSKMFRQAYSSLGKATLRNVSDPNRLFSFLFRAADGILRPSNEKQYYHDSIVSRLKSSLGIDNIVCVGDSHVLILDHVKSLHVFQTGSPTAYNLLNPKSTESGLSQIQEIVSRYSPESTAILFTYAEIDIRNHIPKHSFENRWDYMKSASNVVTRYLHVLKMFADKGFTILVNGPFGTGVGVPNYGYERDRNVIAECVDKLLAEAINTIPIAYTS